MTSKRYIDVAETAKLARKILAEAFPGHKFSVRSDSYSMGSEVRIRWTDGPSVKQVQSFVGVLDGTYFDGMIDYAGSRYALLDGEVVHFLPGISTYREQGPASTAFIAAWQSLHGPDRRALCHKLEVYGYGMTEDDGYGWALSAWSFYPEPCASPTSTRIQFYGDDGYGAGTVGTPENRSTGNGYPRN